MKFLIVLACILVPAALADSKTYWERCLIGNGATPERLPAVLNLVDKLTDNEKCILACGLEFLGVFKNGRVSPVFKRLIPRISGIESEDSHRQAALLEKCSRVTADSQCNLAYKFVKCIKAGNGINPLNFLGFL